MSSLTGAFNGVAASSTAGYGLYSQLQRALPGDTSRVVFLRNNIAEVQFDCCLSESHAYQSTPTSFPIEDGSMIADHIQTAPIQLQLTGVVADHPPESQSGLFAAGVSAIGSAALQPLGAVGVLGSTVGYATLASAAIAKDEQNKGNKAASLSRSAAVYATLRRLAGFSQVDDGSKSQPLMPADVVDVVTAKLGKQFCRFGSMAITSLEMQRDNSVGSRALVFNIAMTEVRRVTRSSSIVSFALPAKQAPKKSVAGKHKEKDADFVYKKQLQEGVRSPLFSGLVDFLDDQSPGINQ